MEIEYICSQGQLRPSIPQHNVNAWRELTPLTYSYPAIANGVVYIGARDNRIHAWTLNHARRSGLIQRKDLLMLHQPFLMEYFM